MSRDERQCRHLAQLLRMRIERDAGRLTLNPKSRVKCAKSRCQPVEVHVNRRGTHVDVDRGVPGVVKTSRDAADHHELDKVIEQHSTHRRDPLVVDLSPWSRALP